jgi:eukaryotic translation initiation factor 2C
MSLSLQAAERISFTSDDKKTGKSITMTIPDFFKQYHGITVTRPRLPCIQVSCLLRMGCLSSADGQYGKKNFIPLEFVHLADWNPLPPTKLSAVQSAE